MLIDQQAVLLLGQLQQAATDQRTTAQLEGRAGCLFGVMLQQAVLLLGQLQQAATDQRTTAQLEGRAGCLFGVMLCGNRGIWRVTQIDAGQREADVGWPARSPG
ncbi:hypothetical protein [Xanthomonas sp. MUS 060]|uniref:hypothetical protein n=1 Tax=Xanthomonas sp. MUS 060 TaxID=1588031 RepID=UPI0006975E63|nr:hypothetical protein [Xanthomonas sp. MUS 060]